MKNCVRLRAPKSALESDFDPFLVKIISVIIPPEDQDQVDFYAFSTALWSRTTHKKITHIFN